MFMMALEILTLTLNNSKTQSSLFLLQLLDILTQSSQSEPKANQSDEKNCRPLTQW